MPSSRMPWRGSRISAPASPEPSLSTSRKMKRPRPRGWARPSGQRPKPMTIERGQGGGEAAVSWRGYVRGAGVRQSPMPKATYAQKHGWTRLRRVPKKRGSIRRWSPMKVVANGRGRRKRRLPFGPSRGRRFDFSPVSEKHGTEGGGFGAVSQRQVQYAGGPLNRQCGH
jgi:hypothetical protein